jgi:hypothetical protein
MNKTLLYTFVMFMILGFTSVEGHPASLNNYSKIDTYLGVVFLVPISYATPSGYRMLKLDEAKTIRDKLLILTGPWGIVAVDFGRLEADRFYAEITPGAGWKYIIDKC